jgi:hypothetical protein
MMRVRPAQSEDAGELAPRLREADLREIRAVTREEPRDVLRAGIAASDPGHAVVGAGGEVLALFGVIPGPAPGADPGAATPAGSVWLLGSDALVARPRAFVHLSRAALPLLFERYRSLGNVVDCRNVVHVRWLRWAGFTIHRTLSEYGVERRPFHAFSQTRAA